MADFNPCSISHIEGSLLWLEQGDKCKYSNGIDGFHDEIEDCFSILSPTAKEIEKRTEVFDRIRSVILQIWPTARVETFGSFRFGLFLPSSDIDIRVLVGDRDMDVDSQREVLNRIKTALTVDKLILQSKTKLLDGKMCEVAVLKVTDKISTVNVDIVAKKVKGPDAAELIQIWCDQWPMAPKLFLVLKQFIVFHKLDGVYRGGLNSYSLIIMIVCFLRKIGKELKWNMDTYPISPGNVNLGMLLLHFLQYYGTKFDYQQEGLRVREGGSFFRKNNNSNNQRQNVLTIEDPLEQNHNISGGTFGIDNVQRAFAMAANTLRRYLELYHRFFPEIGFLGRIVRISPSTILYRKRILKDFTRAELEDIRNSESELVFSVSSCTATRFSNPHVLQQIWPRHNNSNNNANYVISKSRHTDFRRRCDTFDRKSRNNFIQCLKL